MKQKIQAKEKIWIFNITSSVHMLQLGNPVQKQPIRNPYVMDNTSQLLRIIIIIICFTLNYIIFTRKWV